MRPWALATIVTFAWVAASGQQPVMVGLCDLLAHPHKYDKRQISVRAKVSYGFEDFTLVSECDLPRTTPWIWLTYGGTEPSGSISTVNDHVTRHRNLRVDGKEVLLRRDESFRRFKRDIATLARKKESSADERYSPAYSVTATLTGIFLAGNKGDEGMGGYGHLGCCRLLVIQEIDNVEVVATSRGRERSLCQPYDVTGGDQYSEIDPKDLDSFLYRFVGDQVKNWIGHPIQGLAIVKQKDQHAPKSFSTYSIRNAGEEVGMIGIEQKKAPDRKIKVQVNWMNFLDCH